jgi:hypothetical protein
MFPHKNRRGKRGLSRFLSWEQKLGIYICRVFSLGESVGREVTFATFFVYFATHGGGDAVQLLPVT